ncbi:MAG: pirin family protein, partial [Actinomycetota bacterium]
MTTTSIQRADDRFLTDIGWLHSRHSFNFGHHYSPAHQGHGLLLVN